MCVFLLRCLEFDGACATLQVWPSSRGPCTQWEDMTAGATSAQWRGKQTLLAFTQ